ncbi:MAG: hypothetical protein J6Y89_01570 [Lachnospiraceae bacterium]|nr:hypothetical protein [Lachnospiraceae bacterium]
MKYSDKLNGYWEEGYHFYFEIRDEKLTVREYRRKITLETTISYDADSVEAGLKTPIKLEDNVLSYGGSNNPMSWFEEFYFEDGFIKLVEGYSFMDRKDPYTMKKVERGPFDHIIIRDDEFLDKLQGVWLQWSISGDYSKGKRTELYIDGNVFHWRLHSGKFHVISYDRDYDRDSVYLVPWDLTESDFSSCTRFTVEPYMLTTNEMIYDVSTPLSVFAREENIDKIEVPEGAKAGYTSVMGPIATNVQPGGVFGTPGFAGPTMFDFVKMTQTQNNPMSQNTSSGSDVTEVNNVTGGGNQDYHTGLVNALYTKAEENEEDYEKPEFIPVQKEGDNPRRLAKPFKCRKCGQEFTDTLPRFCHNCGWPL